MVSFAPGISAATACASAAGMTSPSRCSTNVGTTSFLIRSRTSISPSDSTRATAMAGLAADRSNAPAAWRVSGPVRLGATSSVSRPSPQWRTADRYRRSSAARGPR